MKPRSLLFEFTAMTVLAIFITLSAVSSCNRQKEVDSGRTESVFKDGDIIFQTSNSGQSKAIQLATKSGYSHCGIIYFDKGVPMVFEAIEPVTVTPLSDWIARGKDRHYVVKRLKESQKILTPSVLTEMKKQASKQLGKRYDKTFEWSDDRMYCSELVWKTYHEATGLELGRLQQLKELDLTSPEVKKIMKSRYPNGIPYDEKVISPASIFSSDLLVKVEE